MFVGFRAGRNDLWEQVDNVFGAGARVFHHPASRDLSRPALREQHVFGVLGRLGFFWGGAGRVWEVFGF